MGSESPRQVFCALPLFINAFTCQQNAFNALGELRNPTTTRRTCVVVAAPLLPMLLYLTVASAGYLTFGDAIQSNIINSYPQTPLVSVARAVLGIVVLCNFPLQIFPSRVSVSSLLESCSASPKPDLPQAEAGYLFWRKCVHGATPKFVPSPLPTAYAPKPMTSSRRTFISSPRERRVVVSLLITTATIALFVTDLGEVVSIIGASGATLMGVITPAATYLLLTAGAESQLTMLRCLSAMLLIVGVAVVPTIGLCR